MKAHCPRHEGWNKDCFSCFMHAKVHKAEVERDAARAETLGLLDRIEKLEGKLLADQINAAPHPHLVIEAVAALVDRRAKQRPWVARQFEDLAYDIRKMKK